MKDALTQFHKSSWYEATARQRVAGLLDTNSFKEFIDPTEREVSPHLKLFDLPEAFDPADYYLADFSSRPQPGQDLDVTGPGNFVVGPFETNGQTNWFFLNGTSMSSPHVVGFVALMKQKNPGITAVQAEAILESTAHFMGAGTNVVTASGTYTWPANATGAGWADARAALALVPNDPDVLSHTGEAYELLGERSLATQYLQKALSHGYASDEMQLVPGMQSLLSDSAARHALNLYP